MGEPNHTTSLTFARPLSLDDFTRREGVVITPLGPETFHIGDFLARSYKREWIISKERMEQHYRLVLGTSTGWACYKLQDASIPYSH